MKTRLLLLAEYTAARRGFAFAPGCRDNLTTLIEGSLGHLAGADEVREARVVAAEGAVVGLVETMVAVAVTDPAKPTELHEFTLDKAKSLLCPLWPFC